MSLQGESVKAARPEPLAEPAIEVERALEQQPARGGTLAAWVRPLFLLGTLFVFFLSLDLLGQAFGLFGRGLAATLVERTSNPFVGLFIGILGTALAQSSSTTTSLTVALVAAGALTIEGAIPIIMGANIGTSVTNTLVSLAHVTRRSEFERAFAGATVHDLFNAMTVLIVFPLELMTGFLSRVVDFPGIHRGARRRPAPARSRSEDRRAAGRRGHRRAARPLAGRHAGRRAAAAVPVTEAARRPAEGRHGGRAEQMLHRTLFRSPLRAITPGF
jgi:uncharacterized membrane protein